MSHSNTTTNFGLPQFITTDKPAWLTDVNVAYQSIDTAMKNNQTAAASAQSDATQALSDASAASSAASTAASTANGSIASLANIFSDSSTYVVGDRVIYNNLLYKCIANVDIPGAWTGSTNWSRTTIDACIDGLTGNDIEYSAGVTVNDKLDDMPTKTSDLVNDSGFATSAYVDRMANGLKFAHITSTTDGKNYTVRFGDIGETHIRIPVLVLHATQTGNVFAAETVVLKRDGSIITQSDSHITQSMSYRFTIDNGTNAWSEPIVIYPGTLCTVETT